MGSGLRRDAELNRQKILAAARDGFADRGLGITLDEIARLAGVGVGTVYRRFPTKDALIGELFAERMDDIAELAAAALGEADPWSGLRMFLESAVALFAADRALRELVIGGAHTSPAAYEGRRRLDPLIQQLIERAQASGDLREDIRFTDVPLILMMLDTVVDTGRQAAPDLWRRMLEVVLDGLRTRRDGPSPLRVPALTVERLEQVAADWRP